MMLNVLFIYNHAMVELYNRLYIVDVERDILPFNK